MAPVPWYFFVQDVETGRIETQNTHARAFVNEAPAWLRRCCWDWFMFSGLTPATNAIRDFPASFYLGAENFLRSFYPFMKSLNDSSTTVAELKARILAFVRERDWEQFHAPKNLSMALAAEAGELMEHFLWAESAASREIVHKDAARRKKIEEELADVIIYALEFANATGIDVAAAIESKMEANGKKYPVEKARGRSEKYTEL